MARMVDRPRAAQAARDGPRARTILMGSASPASRSAPDSRRRGRSISACRRAGSTLPPCGGACGIDRAAPGRAGGAVRATPTSSPASPATPTAGFVSRDARRFSRFASDAVYPYGAGGPNACFALLTDASCAAGATREDFGQLCIAQRQKRWLSARADAQPADHGAISPHARSPMPLALFDCVMPCAGAEAFW